IVRGEAVYGNRANTRGNPGPNSSDDQRPDRPGHVPRGPRPLPRANHEGPSPYKETMSPGDGAKISRKHDFKMRRQPACLLERRRRYAPRKPATRASPIRPETIEPGSGTVRAEIVTVPGVLVKGMAEVSAPVEKSNTSKKVDVLELIEPSPEAGTRLIVYE